MVGLILAAFGLLAALAGLIIGVRQVMFLRSKTEDDGLPARVLSADLRPISLILHERGRP